MRGHAYYWSRMDLNTDIKNALMHLALPAWKKHAKVIKPIWAESLQPLNSISEAQAATAGTDVAGKQAKNYGF
jgi:hypothetical protein